MVLLGLLSAFFCCLIVLMHQRTRQMQQSLKDLRDTHEKINTIMKVVPAGLFQASADGQCLFVNETWCNFTGFSKEDALGDGWKAGLHSEDVKRVENEFRQASLDKLPVLMTYQYRAKGGELRWIHTKAVPHLDENGGLICYYGASIDMTAQKQNEAELINSRNLLSTILENLPVALVCKDAQNNFAYTFANRKAQEIVGMPEHEMVAKTDFEIFPQSAAEQIRRDDQAVYQTGQTIEVLGRDLTLPTGKSVYVYSRRIPLRDENGEVRMVLGIFEDQTAKRDNEKLIEDQRVKLIHSEKMSALGEMAGGIAHEINNPLTVIELNASQLKTMLARGERDLANLAKYTDRISGTVQRIAKIVRGLKAFARDGEGDPFEVSSVEALVREAFDFCQVRFQEHSVDFQMPSAIGNVMIESRSVQLSQVFLNLLNNAFDAVQSQPDAWVRVEVQEAGENVEISIIDSGSGIPSAVAEKIMQPFFTTKELGKGTGLGLSVSQSIVKGHNGKIYLDSSHPHTCFVVRLPKSQNLSELKGAA